MDKIGIWQEHCPVHGRIIFIEHLPEKTLLDEESMNACSSFMYHDENVLTILGENGVATYDLQRLNDQDFYATLNDWHLYDPPVVKHMN